MKGNKSQNEKKILKLIKSYECLDRADKPNITTTSTTEEEITMTFPATIEIPIFGTIETASDYTVIYMPTKIVTTIDEEPTSSEEK